MDFVRTLRELTDAHVRGERIDIDPVLVYGALILAPDVPAELYVSLGALTLAHALGIERVVSHPSAMSARTSELPADMALLFTASMPDETTVHGL